MRSSIRTSSVHRPQAVRAQLASCGERPSRALQNRHICRRSVILDAYVLQPSGDGNSDHLEEKISAPGSIKLEEGTWQLGRDKPADIVVPVPTVSGRHAQLKVEGSKVQVTDLGSTNGTFVNDQELTADKTVDLAVGTEVTFGDDHLAKFVLQEE